MVKQFQQLLVMSVLLLLLAGCGFKAKEQPAPAEPVLPEPAPVAVPASVPEIVPAPAVEPEPAPVEEPSASASAAPAPAPAPEPAPQAPVETSPEPSQPSPYTASASGYADERVANLVERFAKTDSYSFYYATSENWNLLRDQYFVKGSKIKIKLYEPNQWNKRTYFDTVYLDTATQTAEAYCESRERERCTDSTRKFSVEYADYKIALPGEWVTSLPYSTQIVGGEQVEDRAAVVVEYSRSDGATVRVSVDKFSGVPILVQVYQGELENPLERYLFKEITVNSVKSSYMVH